MKQTSETVLLYGIKDAKKEMRLKGILIQMGVRIKNVFPEQSGCKVGYLAGIKELEAVKLESENQIEENTKTEIIPDEMLIMRGFTNGRLDFLLKEMRRANVKVELKAIVTDNNQHWTMIELYEELKKENAAMKAK